MRTSSRLDCFGIWCRRCTVFICVLFFVLSGSIATGQDREIVLGMSGAFSGATRSLGIELYRGAAAYFAKINEQGGVNGNRIRILAYDDGYNPEPAVENTIRLIREDHVFALFNYVGTPTTTRMLPLLAKFSDRHMYLFCPFTGANPMRREPYSKYVFNLRASYDQEVEALVDNLVDMGKTRIAVLHQVDAYGRGGWQGVKKALSKHGLEITAEATYTRGMGINDDFHPQVDIIASRDPDAVICIASYAAAAGFIRDARQSGLEVPIANISFVDAKMMHRLLIKAGEEDDTDYTRNLVNSQVVPFYGSRNLPAVDEYKQCMRKYRPKIPDKFECPGYEQQGFGAVSFEGFLNAKMMVELLRSLGPYPSRKDIKINMDRMYNIDIGLDRKISFTPFLDQGLEQVYFITFRGDQIYPLRDFEEVLN